MSQKFDTRQSKQRDHLSQIASQSDFNTDSGNDLNKILQGANSELTPAFKLYPNDPENLVLNVGASAVVNVETDVRHTSGPIQGNFLDFTSGTITLPAASGGTITVSPTIVANPTLTISPSSFIKCLVQMDSLGNLSVSLGTEGASEALAGNPSSDKQTLPIGILIISTNAGGVVQNVTGSSIIQILTPGVKIGVDTFNTLTGDVTISGGTGISLNPSGNDVEINNDGVLSVNTLSGAVTLSAGNAISLTPSGNDIAIANTGVRALNSLTGLLSIVAGANISVTPAGSNITIAATASSGLTGVLATSSSVALAVPAGITKMVAVLVGGGGGGGAGGSANSFGNYGGGGGGGGGGGISVIPISVTPGEFISCTIGGGGAGGTGASPTSNPGSAGGITSISGSFGVRRTFGGAGGLAGAGDSPTSAGGGGAPVRTSNLTLTNGGGSGAIGQSLTNGGNGQDSPYATGGLFNNAYGSATTGGGGGGGAASYGNGANGGRAGAVGISVPLVGDNAAVGSGAGGGGGGGAAQAGIGATGGTGGGGAVYLFY